jgi:hypothetical protein
MQVTYCELWSDEIRSPVNPMAVAVARDLNDKGAGYSAVIGNPSSPDVVLDVAWSNSFLAASFIDAQGRTHTKYSFNRIDDSRLFLSEVMVWTYSGDAKYEFEADVVETATFRTDGYVRREIDDADSQNIQVSEYSDVPVELNWEPVPRFGDWASVARYDREKPSSS